MGWARGESRMRTLSGEPGVEGDLARNQAKNGARSGSGRCACNRRHASKRISASSIVGGSTLVPGAEARRRYLYLAYRPVTVRTDKLCVQPVCTWRLALVHSQRKTWGTYPSLSLPCPSLSAPYRASIYLWSGALVHLSWGISHQPAGDLQTQSMPGLVPEAAGLVWAEVKNSDSSFPVSIYRLSMPVLISFSISSPPIQSYIYLTREEFLVNS